MDLLHHHVAGEQEQAAAFGAEGGGVVARADDDGAAEGGAGKLAEALDAQESLADIVILRFPLFATIGSLTGAFENASTPCVTPDQPPFVCANPDTYLFWDGIHPTKAAHALIAAAVRDYFDLVKE